MSNTDKRHRMFHLGSQNDALYIISGEAPSPNGNDYPRHDADRTCIAKVFDEAEAKRLVDAANAVPSATTESAAVQKVLNRRCTSRESFGDPACECCTHHWHALREYVGGK